MRLARLGALAGLVGALLGAVCSGCPGTAVQRQATTADVVARAFNRALPVWIGVAERECNGVVERAASRTAALAAYDACEGRWRRVSSAWESARLAHGVWRTELMRCQLETADAGPSAACGPSVDSALGAFAVHVTEYRCALRANGHGEIDQLPGAPDCAVRDGGSL